MTTPCQRCAASGLECVIGGSNRGGRRVRRKTAPDQDTSQLNRSPAPELDGNLADISATNGLAGLGADAFKMPNGVGEAPGAPLALDPSLQSANAVPATDFTQPTRESSAGTGNIAFNDLQNPSDALGIL